MRSGPSSLGHSGSATQSTRQTDSAATTGATRLSTPRGPTAVGPGAARQARRCDLPAGRPTGPRPHKGRTGRLSTSNEPAPHETAIREVFGVERPRPRRPATGRPPKPVKALRPGLRPATLRKQREEGRVMEVVRTPVFGTHALLQALLGRPTVSTTIDTSFEERHNDGPPPGRAEASRKRRLPEGAGVAPGGLIDHQIRLQLLLGGPGPASPWRAGRRQGPRD
jgi:hypothetical protein